jgi:hypothetical protein
MFVVSPMSDSTRAPSEALLRSSRANSLLAAGTKQEGYPAKRLLRPSRGPPRTSRGALDHSRATTSPAEGRTGKGEETCAHASAVSTQFSTVVAKTSGRRGHCPPCPAGLGGTLLLQPLHRPPLGSCRRQYLPPVLVEVELPNVSGTGQRVEKHLTCRVVSRRRDLYEVGVSHVLLRSNSPAGLHIERPRRILTGEAISW